MASQLVYRASTVQLIVSSALFQSLQLAFLGILLNRFGAIGSWSPREILLLFGVRSCAHAIFTIPFWQIQTIEQLVRQGQVDHVLHRPGSPFAQIVAGGFTVATLGDGVVGVAVLSSAIALQHSLTAWDLLYLLSAIVGGGLVEAGLNILLAAAVFPLRDTLAMRLLLGNIGNDLGGIPINLLGPAGASIFTYVVPFAFVAYLPVAVILGKTLDVPRWLAYGAPLLGPVLFGAAIKAFNWAIRFYDSPSGSA